MIFDVPVLENRERENFSLLVRQEVASGAYVKLMVVNVTLESEGLTEPPSRTLLTGFMLDGTPFFRYSFVRNTDKFRASANLSDQRSLGVVYMRPE